MRRQGQSRMFFFTVFLLLYSASAFTQSERITRFTIDSGGARSSGGDFALHGTVAQPDAGVLSGGTYRLQGGFWQAGVARGSDLFSNGFE